MKKLLCLILAIMLLTSCGAKEKYPPQKQDFGEDESGRFTTRTSYFDENEEVMKIVLKTSIPNGYREEILFDRDAQ